jgi:hypothetical protein
MKPSLLFLRKKCSSARKTAEELAKEATDFVMDNIINRGGGLSTEECLEALGIVEEFCCEWRHTMEDELNAEDDECGMDAADEEAGA